jgi:hypothetical protein
MNRAIDACAMIAFLINERGGGIRRRLKILYNSKQTEDRANRDVSPQTLENRSPELCRG